MAAILAAIGTKAAETETRGATAEIHPGVDTGKTGVAAVVGAVAVAAVAGAAVAEAVASRRS